MALDSDAIPLKAQSNPSPSPPSHLYAPQPQAYPRDVEAYGEVSQYRTSTDEIGWDMRPVRHAHGDEMYRLPNSSNHTVQQGSRPRGAASPKAPAAASSYARPQHTAEPGMAQTPTQAQFVTYSALDDGPLPTPTFHPPPGAPPSHAQDASDSMYYGHGQEPTDATYRTALSSREPSDDEMPPPTRVYSPPPPSYRTDVRR